MFVKSNQEFVKERGQGRSGFNPKLEWVKHAANSDSLQ